jgi:hypothetical protein
MQCLTTPNHVFYWFSATILQLNRCSKHFKFNFMYLNICMVNSCMFLWISW